MKIDSAHFTLDLVKANIIEPFEAGACYRTDAVVWHQKVLFPAHEDSFSLSSIANSDGALASLLLEGTKSGEFGPVAQIDLAICTPVLVLGIEAVLGSNNFSLKIRCECRMIFGQTFNSG